MNTLSKKVPVSVYAETTPNPEVMKFVISKTINPYDSAEFKNKAEAQDAPLADAFFAFPFVEEVFIAKNFVAITKTKTVSWEEVAMPLREFTYDFLSQDKCVINAAQNTTEQTENSESESVEQLNNSQGKIPSTATEHQIVDILDNYVRPNVAKDGGDITFHSFNDGVLSLKLQGACSGCPSSTVTLKQGIENLFVAGFKEFARLRKSHIDNPSMIVDGTHRAMRVALSREVDSLETHLPFMATVGSISPYIGLFGTVWGIMNSFIGLGAVQQATLSMVAPGIAEALIATAMGLFAAIPAVMAFNRFSHKVEKLENSYGNFMEEFASILQRQTVAGKQD